jgi:hypothetical protein
MGVPGLVGFPLLQENPIFILWLNRLGRTGESKSRFTLSESPLQNKSGVGDTRSSKFAGLI